MTGGMTPFRTTAAGTPRILTGTVEIQITNDTTGIGVATFTPPLHLKASDLRDHRPGHGSDHQHRRRTDLDRRHAAGLHHRRRRHQDRARALDRYRHLTDPAARVPR